MRFGTIFCALLMATVAVVALVYWGASWGPLLLLAVGIGCLVAIIYTWITARRIDRQLDRVVQRGREDHK